LLTIVSPMEKDAGPAGQRPGLLRVRLAD